MTIIEVCPELDCDFRIVHEINTTGFQTDGMIVKAPIHNTMKEHELQHKLMRGEL